MTTTFEHKVLTIKQRWKGFDYEQLERDLDDLGGQGWEVVGTLAPGIGNGHTHELAVLLKRTRA